MFFTLHVTAATPARFSKDLDVPGREAKNCSAKEDLGIFKYTSAKHLHLEVHYMSSAFPTNGPDEAPEALTPKHQNKRP